MKISPIDGSEITSHKVKGQRNWTTQESLQLYHELSIISVEEQTIDGVVDDFYEIYSQSNETVKWCKNLIRLSAGSALYCKLIADLYIHINGSNSVRIRVAFTQPKLIG